MRGISTVDDPICSTSRMQLRVWKARQSEAQMNFPHSTKHRRNLNHDIIELQHQSKQRMQQGCTSYERIGTLHARYIILYRAQGWSTFFVYGRCYPRSKKNGKKKEKKWTMEWTLDPDIIISILIVHNWSPHAEEVNIYNFVCDVGTSIWTINFWEFGIKSSQILM